MKLTVYHDGQFWVGVVEYVSDSTITACRHLFGSEPHDADVLEFVNYRMMSLIENTSESVVIKNSEERRVNPKRLARKVAKEMKTTTISTQAQAAIRAEYESRKEARKQASRAEKEDMMAKKRQIAREKAKAKHRGR